jgi:hypothetical protein
MLVDSGQAAPQELDGDDVLGPILLVRSRMCGSE